jgi:hypothetical protein
MKPSQNLVTLIGMVHTVPSRHYVTRICVGCLKYKFGRLATPLTGCGTDSDVPVTDYC